MLYVLDWCVVCTGLVCCMYWTGVLHVLDWCVVCTGLVCCVYWTGVLHVLDWYVVYTRLVCCICWTGVLYVLDWCSACWTGGILNEGGEALPLHLHIRGRGWWWEELDTSIPSLEF